MTLEPPSGFEHGIPGLGIQHLEPILQPARFILVVCRFFCDSLLSEMDIISNLVLSSLRSSILADNECYIIDYIVHVSSHFHQSTLHCSCFISFPSVHTSVIIFHFYFLQSTVHLIHFIYQSPSCL